MPCDKCLDEFIALREELSSSRNARLEQCDKTINDLQQMMKLLAHIEKLSVQLLAAQKENDVLRAKLRTYEAAGP